MKECEVLLVLSFLYGSCRAALCFFELPSFLPFPDDESLGWPLLRRQYCSITLRMLSYMVWYFCFLLLHPTHGKGNKIVWWWMMNFFYMLHSTEWKVPPLFKPLRTLRRFFFQKSNSPWRKKESKERKRKRKKKMRGLPFTYLVGKKKIKI